MSYEELAYKTAGVTARVNTVSDRMKDLETALNDNAALQKHIVNCSKTRATYVEYRKAGYSKRFRETHEADILLHQAAKKAFDALGLKKLSTVASLRADYKPGWKKGVYPTEMFIQDSIKNAEMIIGVNDNHLISAMVMNHDYADGYENVKWQVNAKKDEIIVIHALGISSAYQGQGIAKQMVAYAVKNSKDKNLKSIRLDVLGTNLPAQRLYTAMGFRYIDTIKLFYEDTGLTDFLLYELIL